MGLAANVRKGLRKSIAIPLVIAIVALGILGILTTNVVNLGRILDYRDIGSVLSQEEITTLTKLKKFNGWLLIIPILIFLMSAGDLGKTTSTAVTAPEKLILDEAKKQVSGKQGPLNKRPLVFGTIFILLTVPIIVALVYTGIEFGKLAEKTQTLPVSTEKLQRLRLVCFYTLIIPLLLVVFSLVLIFKAIKGRIAVKNANKEEAEAEAAAAEPAPAPAPAEPVPKT